MIAILMMTMMMLSACSEGIVNQNVDNGAMISCRLPECGASHS